MTVGILALQGDFREHEQVLQRLGVATQHVRLPQHLDVVERLIIPGGESTTIGKLLVKYNLLEPIIQRAQRDLSLWGTCAGAILMARQMSKDVTESPRLNLMDIVVQRNAFGRQLDSFETTLHFPKTHHDNDSQPVYTIRGVFIRAPKITSVGSEVEVLSRLPEDGSVVAARQGRLFVTTFHPELTTDTYLHRYFLTL